MRHWFHPNGPRCISHDPACAKCAYCKEWITALQWEEECRVESQKKEGKMKKVAIKAAKLAVMLLFGVVAAALCQNPPTKQLKPSDDLQLKIVRIQKHISDLQIRANAAQAALQAASTDYQKSNQDLSALVDQAYKDAGLKKEEYDLDPDTLEFTKKAVPAPVSSQPVTDPKASKKQ